MPNDRTETFVVPASAGIRGYLRDVLSRLQSMTNQDDLTPLTPGAWQPS
jgi:hypothetical protein